MRIHQITDLHVPEEGCDPEFDHVKANVLRQLAFIEKDHSDLLVISGDLTMQDASPAACQWINQVLPQSLKTIVMPGNHDDPGVIWDVFGAPKCVDRKFFFVVEQLNWNLVFLNTTTDRLPQDQLQFLTDLALDVPCILFVHHPPDLISDGFMALNQPLHNHAEVAAAIRTSAIQHVFCGHYHNWMDKNCDGFELHLTSSPAFQIDLHAIEFKMQPFEPAVRVIEVGKESVITEVVFV